VEGVFGKAAEETLDVGLIAGGEHGETTSLQARVAACRNCSTAEFYHRPDGRGHGDRPLLTWPPR